MREDLASEMVRRRTQARLESNAASLGLESCYKHKQ